MAKTPAPTAASRDEQKQAALAMAIGQIEKAYGKGSVMYRDNIARLPVSVISTGAIALDLALGVGGLPRGRITEIYGAEGSGKSSLCFHVIAEAQKAGGLAAFIDMEHAVDPVFAAKCGMDMHNLVFLQPDTGEQALEDAETLIRSGAIDVVVIDSVAALVPKAEIDGDMGDSHMGLQARLMSQGLRKIAAAINHTNTCVIFTNQLRMKIGVVWGNPEVQPGGRALKFWAGVRLEVKRGDSIKRGDLVIGHRMRVNVVKNKVAPPFRHAEFDIMYYANGISKSGGVLDVGEGLAIIAKTGSHYAFGEEKLGHGHEAAKAYLDANPETMAKIATAIYAKVEQHGSPAPGMTDTLFSEEEELG